MALISFSEFKDKAHVKYGLSYETVEMMRNKGFLSDLEGKYDDYFIENEEQFKRILNEFEQTSSYLTPAEVTAGLLKKGVNIPPGDIEALARENKIESYLLSNGKFLFKPDIIENSDYIQEIYDNFINENELDDLFIDEDFSDDEENKKDESEDKTEDIPEDDFFDDFDEDDKPNKKKSKRTASQPSVDPDAAARERMARDDEARHQREKAEQEKRKTGDSDVFSTGASTVVPPVSYPSGAVTPSVNDVPSTPVSSASVYSPPSETPASTYTPSSPNYPIKPEGSKYGESSYKAPDPVSSPAPAASEQYQAPASQKDAYTSATPYVPNEPSSVRSSNEEELRRREAIAREEAERKRYENSKKQSGEPEAPKIMSNRDSAGNIVYDGYGSEQQKVLFEEIAKKTVEPHTQERPAQVDNLVERAQTAYISSHNILSQSAINKIVDYVRTNNETVDVPLKDGSVMRFESTYKPSESHTAEYKPDSYKTDYQVSQIKLNEESTTPETKVLYSSSDLTAKYNDINDTYCKSMGVTQLDSGFDNPEQSKTDDKVLYAVGVLPATPSFASVEAPSATQPTSLPSPAQAVSAEQSKDYTTVVIPAHVEFIHPKIIESYNVAGVTQVQKEGERVAVNDFNPRKINESLLVESAYLGSENSIKQAIAPVGVEAVVSNSVSKNELTSYVNKIRISEVTTDNVISEHAINEIIRVAKEENKKFELPLYNGNSMVFSPNVNSDGKVEVNVFEQKATDSDYNIVTSKQIYSTDATNAQSGSLGAVYSAYANGMQAERLESSNLSHEQKENDKRVLFAVGAVDKNEFSKMVQGDTIVAPKGVSFINSDLIDKQTGVTNIRIDNRKQELTQYRESLLKTDVNSVNESVFLGSYDKVYTTLRSSEASAYVKETFGTSNHSGKTISSPVVKTEEPTQRHPVSQGAGIAVAVANRAKMRTITTETVNVAVPVSGKHAKLDVAPVSNNPVVRYKQQNLITGKETETTILKTGKDNVSVFTKNSDGRVTNVTLLGNETNAKYNFKPGIDLGIEKQVGKANARINSTDERVYVFVDAKGARHLGVNPRHIKQRVVMTTYLQEGDKVIRRAYSPKAAESAEGSIRAVRGRFISKNRTELLNAIARGDYERVLEIRKASKKDAESKLSDSDKEKESKFVGMRYKDVEKAKKDAQNASYARIAKQFGRLSGMKSSNSYFMAGAEILFGYTSAINVISDFGLHSAAKATVLANEKAMLENLLIDDLRDLTPNLFSKIDVDLTRVGGRRLYTKELSAMSKSLFNADMTRFSTFKLKSILNDGKFNGKTLTNEQRELLIATLKLKGFSMRDASAFNIGDNLARKGIKIKGKDVDGKSFDLSQRNVGRGRHMRKVNYDLSKINDLRDLRTNLLRASDQFRDELHGLRLNDLSKEQLSMILNGKLMDGTDASEGLRALVSSYVTVNDQIKAKLEAARNKMAKFSRLSVLFRKAMSDTDVMHGINTFIMAKDITKLSIEAVRFTGQIMSTMMRPVKFVYSKTIGALLKKINDKFNITDNLTKFVVKTIGKIVEKITDRRNALSLKYKNTKVHALIERARANLSNKVNLVTGRIKNAKNRAVRQLKNKKNAAKKAAARKVKEAKTAIRKRAVNALTKTARRRKAVNRIKKASAKGKRLAQGASKFGKALGAGIKRVYNIAASPFRAISSVFKVFNQGKKFVMKIVMHVAKYVIMAVMIIALIELILGMMNSVISLTHSVNWFSDDDSVVDEIDNPETIAHNLLQDRIDFCINMDSALKIYLTSITDEACYKEEFLGDDSKNSAVEEVLESEEIVNEEDEWFDPNKPDKRLNISALGCKIGDIQTGVHFSYYDGDGNEIGMRSNAKDIVSMLNVWMFGNFAPKGLAKSYVEKLWNYSHMVNYYPKMQGNGKYVYACDPTRNDNPCYGVNYHYHCNDEDVPFYKFDSEGYYDNDESKKLIDAIHTNEDIYKYSKKGCAEHEVIYHGGEGNLFSRRNSLSDMGCSNIGRIEIASGINGSSTEYYCKGCSECTETFDCTDSDCNYSYNCHGSYTEDIETKHSSFTFTEINGDPTGFLNESDACNNHSLRVVNEYEYEEEITEYRPDPNCKFWLYNEDGCICDSVFEDGTHHATRVITTYKTIREITYWVECNGHTVEQKFNKCDGYCEGHSFDYCKGHIDIDVSVATLFLDDNNGLTKLGVPKKVDRSYTVLTSNQYGETDSNLVEVQSVEPDSFITLYKDVEKFKGIKLLKLPNPDDLKDEILMKMPVINNVQEFSNNTVDTLKFLFYYTTGDGNYNDYTLYDDENGEEVKIEDFTNFNQLIGSLFKAFEVCDWQDLNDQGTWDGGEWSGVWDGAPRHLAGTYSKFNKYIEFEGWYSYSDDLADANGQLISETFGLYTGSSTGSPEGTATPATSEPTTGATDSGTEATTGTGTSGTEETTVYVPDDATVTYWNKAILESKWVNVPKVDAFGEEIIGEDGKVQYERRLVYNETSSIDRAKNMVTDDWSDLYKIDFPGSHKGSLDEKDLNILKNKTASLHGIRNAQKAEIILNTINNTGYTQPDSPRGNVDYAKAICGLLGAATPWGTIPSGVDDLDAMKYVAESTRGGVKVVQPLNDKSKLRTLLTGDIIVISNEMYVVVYNDYKESDGIVTGQVLCTTVAGGGTPRLVAFSGEGLCKPDVGYGYIKVYSG